jgi:hypothetical protein
VRITRPEAGSALNLPRYRIEAELDRPVFAEVTFAVSLAGGEYAVLGTDDAAPYRVYWDNSALPDGTAVEVMATVDDLTGGRSVATVSFSLGARESLP